MKVKMTHSADLIQNPAPGTALRRFQGDVLAVELEAGDAGSGAAYLRTNLGRAAVRRAELIAEVHEDAPVLARDWHDLRMRPLGDGRYRIDLPLAETGCFEAKAFFLPEGTDDPLWPTGANLELKVESAGYSAANTLYTAFVRQFGPAKTRSSRERAHPDPIRALDAKNYTVIPPSGTFRDLIAELDFIIGTLGFRIVQLLPVHPIPTTFARMGRFGSPFAALDFMDVNPALAEFDRRVTPLGQFQELADAIHRRGARLFLDLPVNHTGWASSLQVHHPGWFARKADLSFRSPGAWGVTWADLSELDYRHRPLWRYMAEVFLFWCRRGVDGFRCDAGYMVPFDAWVYIVARVRAEYPDTLFLLEGLGGPVEVTEDLLAHAGLDWAYSELFQNYTRDQIEGYLPEGIRVSTTRGTLIHFAETHDNDRLASRSRSFARLRTMLTALCSDAGAFGITNGVEWFADEKIDVHEANALDWGREENQVERIARLTSILRRHPAFYPGAELRLIERGEGDVLALRRRYGEPDAQVLVVAQLDEEQAGPVRWAREEFDHAGGPVYDLISGGSVTVEEDDDGLMRCVLPPASVACLTTRREDLERVADREPGAVPEAVRRRRMKAAAMETRALLRGYADAGETDYDSLAASLAEDPVHFCAEAAGTEYAPVRLWRWPEDARRTILLPDAHLLLCRAKAPFRVELVGAGGGTLSCRDALPDAQGAYFVLLAPPPKVTELTPRKLNLTLHAPDATERGGTDLLQLPADDPGVRLCFDRSEVEERGLYAVTANRRAAAAQVRGDAGAVASQYDAVLAANPHPAAPADRRIMLTRFRAWIRRRGYSQAIQLPCLLEFGIDERREPRWRFEVPVGRGRRVWLDFVLALDRAANRVRLSLTRLEGGDGPDALDDREEVSVILRPDLEDRDHHTVTRAFEGAEQAWPAAVASGPDGFVFEPAAGRRLEVRAGRGAFMPEPEWTYMVEHPVEASRGLAGHTDLFSPGYFELALAGGASSTIVAAVNEEAAGPGVPAAESGDEKIRAATGLREAAREAMRLFVVDRDSSRTVIAGYPWFLDWGRDTLIFLRGMIAAGWTEEALDILAQFARFEENGTLPNMIRGEDVSNRDTSDAPLWFLIACRDLAARIGLETVRHHPAGPRTLGETARDIARGYLEGTPVGVKVEADSGLVFSPAHFTWMDTNHPAGSPREGYPIEIQALWYAGLRWLAQLDPGGRWESLAARVRSSAQRLYRRDSSPFCADTLHARPGTPAAQSKADDALRPNQLFAVTLGLFEDPAFCRSILRDCEELVVPGALRSLADRSVTRPLAVEHDGRLLNDPLRPYWGRYEGDEDTRRKPAYHNGTAWTWLYPMYAEAFEAVWGPEGHAAAASLLTAPVWIFEQGCLGQLAEILDGDAPHVLRGCGAQAWSVSELFRVLERIGENR
ncbi:amylo-alpha-1,6-glucosidase [Kiritimatiella glycovorans]|uniref:Alpha-1,4-glucan:maltose-1-phosphate maltosyltransferase 2 n=1 Tax=Kiritimatiella glycovorans TaxID=1307763 RepID=A0A0G3EG14_9BACT|nr:amylo-alpha-1,6-glucosidase [Kiritimatiella glycovorans]AKJ63770.1 Alpha-1,4-glucan:maltose-1-phosphate maltosyltransferase 2 [Kiritimatiella glycovorans]